MADKQQYFSILTDLGRYKIAKAAADKGEVKFTHFAIGDGGGQETSPVPSQTQLVREVWRTQIEAADIDPHNPAAVIIAAIIPRDAGGWWMREFGLFDADGDMLAVVKPAPNYKATMAEGQNEDIIYQFQLVVGDNANVVVLIDPSSQYLTREAADKCYPSREEVKTGIAGVKALNQPWLAVAGIDLKAPPASPNKGDVYLVADKATGAWAGKDGQIAEWRGDNDKWRFTQPLNGHGIGLPNGDVYVRVNDSYQMLKPDLSNYALKSDLGSVNSGWAKYANGMIECWGELLGIGKGTIKVTLPISMPNRIMSACVSDIGEACFPGGVHSIDNSTIGIAFPAYIIDSSSGRVVLNDYGRIRFLYHVWGN